MNKKLDLNELTAEQVKLLIRAEKNPENAMDYHDVICQLTKYQLMDYLGVDRYLAQYV